MKAVVVRQPWATLIALGVKSIETRPWPPNGPMRPEGVRGLPGCTLERGERIAIVAGAAKPKNEHETHYADRDDPTSPLIEANESPWLWNEYDDGTGGWWQWWSGPLGSVVCTVTVDDARPFVAVDERQFLAAGPPGWNGTQRWLVDGDHLWRVQIGDRGTLPDDGDQLPLGDFTPGRWGWMLSDPRPCEPVPCKGKQGVFVLPDEIAEALS